MCVVSNHVSNDDDDDPDITSAVITSFYVKPATRCSGWEAEGMDGQGAKASYK